MRFIFNIAFCKQNLNCAFSDCRLARRFLSDNHNRLSLLVCTTDVPEYLLHLTMTEHDKYGATYCMSNDPEDTLWLCNVTHDILDEHPEHLFILKIQLLD